ncbi:hypothetical protein GCM10009092_24600 [Bowmanella denitrificans]|uniref:Anti-sigma factor n=1 Tax=Bowmanella denitrificans TaxID=366582 RepID=A0ABN0XAM9_9ALTE
MSNKEFEQQLQNALASLPNEIQPRRDLWPGIEHALNSQAAEPVVTSSKAKPYWGMAAAVATVGLLGWLGLTQLPGLSDSAQLAQVLSQQHQQQKQALLASFSGQPALTDNWQQQVDELDAAALAIKQALKEDPNNPALLKMLQQVYQQQIDLIERVHAPAWQKI